MHVSVFPAEKISTAEMIELTVFHEKWVLPIDM